MIRSITIVGNGTAGWLTLAYLSNIFKDINFNFINNETIPTIGVGEGSTPVLFKMLEDSGIQIENFIKNTNGTLKYGINFKNWTKKSSSWLHLFSDTICNDFYEGKNENIRDKRCSKKFIENIFNYKLNEEEYYALSNELYFILKNNKSPSINGKRVDLIPGYAIHMEAELIGKALISFLKNRKNIVFYDKSIVIEKKYVNDRLDYVKTDNEIKIKSDLFIDCTGFHKILIKDHTDYKSYSDLICNSAIAGRIVYENDESKLRVPLTTIEALDFGWVWEIPLFNKIGSGFVYNNNLTDENEASEMFTNYWNKRNKKINILRKIKFNSGRNTVHNYKNIISIGLSSGFIEPLEANSIAIIVMQNIYLKLILEKYNKMWTDKTEKLYNKVVNTEFDNIKDFINYHYIFANKDNTSFWKKNLDLNEHIEFGKQKIINLSKKPFLGKYDTQFIAWNWATMMNGSGLLNGDQNIDSNLTSFLKFNYNSFAKKLDNYSDYLEYIHRNS